MYKRQILEGFDITRSFSPLGEMGFFVDSELVPFNNDAEDFTPQNAWWMAEHSRLAYMRKSSTKKTILKKAGLPNMKFWSIDGTDCYVAYNDKTIVLAFTGTELNEGFKDILIDAEFWPTDWDHGKGWVHSGFERAFNKVWDDVKKYIDGLLENRKLWITGHSLGGALATLAASQYPETQGVYTFGSPRIGNKKFVKSIQAPLYRIVRNRDIVTRVPTPPLYRHVGDLYFINNSQKLKKNPSCFSMLYSRLGGSEWKILFLLVKIIIFKSKLDFILSYFHDHSPYNYSIFMWNNLPKSDEE